MSPVTLVHSTPNGDDLVAYMARVSNPDNQNNTETSSRLIKYLIKHKHWSPFEMVNMCVEIKTTRSIAAQILRHVNDALLPFNAKTRLIGECTVLNALRASDMPVTDAEPKAYVYC